MEIQTARLLLRPYRISDLEDVFAFQSDEEALQFEPWGPNSVEATHKMLDNQSALGRTLRPWNLELAIERKVDHKVIGGCILKLPLPMKEGWATMGYVLQRNYWGMGYATEAAGGLVQFAREQPQTTGIRAISDSHNLASKRVLEKCGMECVGVIAEIEAVKGRFRDMLKYELAW